MGLKRYSFPEFLKWSRLYIKDHSFNEYKDLIVGIKAENFESGIGLDICDKCDVKAIFVFPEMAQRKMRRLGLDRENGACCTNCDNCADCCECFHCDDCDKYKDGSCSDCEKCTDCCECIYCSYSRCNARCNDNYCTECERCLDCCECSYCEGCDTRGDISICHECDRCSSDCCECETCNVKFFNSPLTFHNSGKMGFSTLNPSKRFISAEIEIASIDSNQNLGNIVRKWKGSIVKDGSLPNSGFEINTSPSNGGKFVNQINEIGKELHDGSAKITSECGLHVHIDARDFKYYELRRLVKAYSTIETALFGMVPESRGHSTYCTPCARKYMNTIVDLGKSSYPKVRKEVTKATYGKESTRGGIRTDKYNGARYAAMNIHSWFYRGTIECRLFNGTANPNKIINWGIMWAMILDFVVASNDEYVESMVVNEPIDNLLKITESNKQVSDFIRERFNQYGSNVVQSTLGV